ncbi:bola-like protein [Chiua virens]|nr:bola-like protein [Chiua virens]
MPVQVAKLEKAIRDAFPVSHLEIEDQSSGCGESYSVLLVSEVRPNFPSHRSSTEASPGGV